MEVPTDVYKIVIVSHGPNVRSEAIAQWAKEMSPCRGPGPRCRDTPLKRKYLGETLTLRMQMIRGLRSRLSDGHGADWTSRIEEYCRSAPAKPSVCIRDLTTSIGYITAQSYVVIGKWDSISKILGRKRKLPRSRSTHSIPSSSTIQHCVRRRKFLAFPLVVNHPFLYKLLVCPEVYAVSTCFTDESDILAFEHARYPMCRGDFL